jgi:hypothetical protein
MSTENSKNIKELRTSLILITVGILGLSLVLNYAIISGGKVYSNIARILMILTVSCAILNILLSMFNNILVKVTYIGGSLIGNLTLLSMYLLASNNLMLVSSAAKTIVFLNFFIVEMALFIRRIFIKNNDYIDSIKQGKHNKFVKNDIIVALFISIVLICLAKFIDSNVSEFISQSFDKQIVGICGVAISSIGVVVYITSIANYMYAIKENCNSKVMKRYFKK